MKTISDYEGKAMTLRTLIAEAIREAEQGVSAAGFTSDGFESMTHMDELVEALRMTDAIYVLNEMVSA